MGHFGAVHGNVRGVLGCKNRGTGRGPACKGAVTVTKAVEGGIDWASAQDSSQGWEKACAKGNQHAGDGRMGGRGSNYRVWRTRRIESIEHGTRERK